MRLIPAALVLAFTIYCVVDVVRSESSDVRGLPKTFWLIIILIAPLAGGVAWLVAGRPRSTRLPGTARLSTPRPPVLGPDDDPDFLRTIDRPSPVAPAGPLPPGGRPGTAPARDSTGATADDGGTGGRADGESDDRTGGQADDRTDGHTGSGTVGGVGSSSTDTTGPTDITGDDDPGTGAAAETDDRSP